MECDTYSPQFSDTDVWATGKASSPLRVGCWLIGGYYLTGAICHATITTVRTGDNHLM